MIAKIHKWIKLPIKKGGALHLSYDVNCKAHIRRPRPRDKHNAFASEEITERNVSLLSVDSPLDIILVSNWRGG